MELTKNFASIVDEETKKQVNELANSEAYKGRIIRIMPDCHAGSGCTIGTVISIDERVVPNTVGVDIGCGMLVICLGKHYIDLEKLDNAIKAKVPCGFNIHESQIKSFDKLNDLYCLNCIDINNANRSLGTLGGGNHFIEVDVDDEGNKYLIIHSGSRNLGVRVCKYYQDIAITSCKAKNNKIGEIISKLKAEGRTNEIQNAIVKAKSEATKINDDLAYLDGDAAKMYLHDMAICQEYSMINRMTIANSICKELGLTIEDSFTTIHNYIDIDQKILRKGAVSAMKDERLLIPMNMRDGSLICRGKGNEDWLCSGPHGAGRIMSRKQAFEQLKIDDFKRTMEGIFSSSVCESTLDEAPMVYKSANQIQEDIKDTVDIINVIKPIYNFKAH